MPWDGEVLATGHQEVPEYKFLHEWTCWVILLIMFNIVRNYQFSKAAATNSHQQCKKILISTHPPQDLSLSF